MRIELGFLVFLLIMVSCCVVYAENADVPDVKGTWQNIYLVTDSQITGYKEMAEGDPNYIIVIENQTGHFFEGYKTYHQDLAGELKETFRGVITEDYQHFFGVDDMSGESYADITGPDSFSFYYFHHDIPTMEKTYNETRIIYGKFIRSPADTDT